MLRIFLPHFSILGGQHLPDCHKKQLSKSTEKSNFLPEAGGQLGPDYPQWKRIRTRLRNLIKPGLDKSKAWEFANARKGIWRTAGSPILNRTITIDRLRKAGYIFFTDYYRKVIA